MGSFLSGSRNSRWNRKLTIEECTRLRIAQFYGMLDESVIGTVGAFDVSRGKRNIEINFRIDMEQRTVSLRYWKNEFTIMETIINLDQTETRFRGKRWWFHCCCDRRVADLYLRPREYDFACRHCLQLTYRSAQSAHSMEREMSWTASMEAWVSNHCKNR